MHTLHHYLETRWYLLKQWYLRQSKSKRALLGCILLIGVFALYGLYGLCSAAQQSFAAVAATPVAIPVSTPTPMTPTPTPVPTAPPPTPVPTAANRTGAAQKSAPVSCFSQQSKISAAMSTPMAVSKQLLTPRATTWLRALRRYSVSHDKSYKYAIGDWFDASTLLSMLPQRLSRSSQCVRMLKRSQRAQGSLPNWGTSLQMRFIYCPPFLRSSANVLAEDPIILKPLSNSSSSLRDLSWYHGRSSSSLKITLSVFN